MHTTGCISEHGRVVVVVDCRAKQVPVVDPIQKTVSVAAYAHGVYVLIIDHSQVL